MLVVNKPQTQVEDVTVNIRSINGICVVRDIGRESKNVPIATAAKSETRITRPGEILATRMGGTLAPLLV